MKNARIVKKRRWRDYAFLLFILPAMIWVISFSIYPFMYSIIISFTNMSLLRPDSAKFIFLDNFIELFTLDKAFGVSVLRSFVFTTFVVFFQFALGFFLALLLNKKIRFTPIVRMSVMLPWVLPPIALSLIWAWVLRAGNLGLLNSVLLKFGIGNVNWFGYAIAMFSIIFITIWIGVPFSFMLELASLQKIPDEIYEAASVDGAGSLQKLLYITIPYMKDTFRINLIMITIATVGYFDVIYAITDGGPMDATEVLPMYMYHTAFKSFNMGKGSAIAVSMLLMSLLYTILYIFIFREKKEKVYEEPASEIE